MSSNPVKLETSRIVILPLTKCSLDRLIKNHTYPHERRNVKKVAD